MAEDKRKMTDKLTHSGADEMNEQEIDDNLAGTFPASDPPSWTLGTDHQKEPPAEESPRQPTDESSEG